MGSNETRWLRVAIPGQGARNIDLERLAEIARDDEDWRLLCDLMGGRLATEIGRLRTGLYECAAASGEDVSEGPPTWPHIADWAVEAVKELRREYDQTSDMLDDAQREAANA